ncbi:PFL family protein [Methanopyrus sp. SNP6]|uniref:PFL family protein n=1 Tax=Methanopyrus sp. SNP6 TaxID=1937005 RepID=UPI0011E5AB69|nr:PFL family protein [Methanopyrus sp. SNP6]
MSSLDVEEVIETIEMIRMRNLDVRAVTLGINLLDCAHPDPEELARGVREKIVEVAGDLVEVVEEVEDELGVPVVNKRIAVTPCSLVAASAIRKEGREAVLTIAEALDEAAEEVGVDYLGGYTALVYDGFTEADEAVLDTIPEAIEETERLCASVVVADERYGINMDAVYRTAEAVKETAERTEGHGCARLVALTNAPENTPFMAGAFHGVGQPEACVNVGISGPGVVRAVVEELKDADFRTLHDEIKRTAFKITRVGELVGHRVAERLGVEFGAVDLSLAPTPEDGDSVAEILERIGLESCGCPGSTAALYLLMDAIKKGGAAATSRHGGYSEAFIPVSEDAGMARAAEEVLTLEKLEAMTAVCSVGIDMVVVPGDTPVETIAGIIADEAAIGVATGKPTAVRIIPAPGKEPGDEFEMGGLLGRAPVMDVSDYRPTMFRRDGRIPPKFPR